MNQQNQPVASKRSATLDRTRAYMGDIMSFLINSKETDGKINFLEVQAKKGNEPPPHYHIWENEIFYLLDGNMEVFCEGKSESIILWPNELIFIPQNTVHAVRFLSEEIQMLAIVQAAGDKPVTVDEYFVSMSEPAKTLEMDNKQTKYADIDVNKAVELAAKHGAIFLSAEETAKRLPIYQR